MRHLVRPGECVASLAAKCGVTIESIWNDPANASLRNRRDSPFMLCAGDEIHLPDPPPSQGNVSAGGTHRFTGTPATALLELVLVAESWGDQTIQGRQVDEDGARAVEAPPPTEAPTPEPLANLPYRLTVGGRTIEGRTDGEGRLREDIDARATRVVLELEPDTPQARRFDVAVGYLDPPDEPSGLRQRLSNLGFPSHDDLSLVVEGYQKARGLEPTGELDDATKARILEESEG